MLPQRFFEIELTDNCNLNCIHCRNSVSNSNSLSKNEIDAVLENIFSFPSKDKFIALSGGEPLIYPHIKDVIEKIVSKGIEVQIVTNATMLNRDFYQFIGSFPRSRVYFAVSLDGDRETHNKIRDNRKAFDKTLEAIRQLKKLNFEVAVNFTLNSLNLEQLDFVYGLCVSLKVNILKVRLPIQCGRVHYSDRRFSKHKEYLSVLEKAVILSETKSTKDGIIVESSDPLWWCFSSKAKTNLLSKVKSHNNFLGGCSAGWLQLFIDSKGDVYPCAYLPVKLGNAVKSDLCEILYGNVGFIYDIMNRDKFKKCGDCELKAICGGCRARAFLKSGDLKDNDPFCPLNFGDKV